MVGPTLPLKKAIPEVETLHSCRTLRDSWGAWQSQASPSQMNLGLWGRSRGDQQNVWQAVRSHTSKETSLKLGEPSHFTVKCLVFVIIKSYFKASLSWCRSMSFHGTNVNYLLVDETDICSADHVNVLERWNLWECRRQAQGWIHHCLPHCLIAVWHWANVFIPQASVFLSVKWVRWWYQLPRVED